METKNYINSALGNKEKANQVLISIFKTPEIMSEDLVLFIVIVSWQNRIPCRASCSRLTVPPSGWHWDALLMKTTKPSPAVLNCGGCLLEQAAPDPS